MIYKVNAVISKTQPKIWRQLYVNPNITFADLHQALRLAFCWNEPISYEFSIFGYNLSDKRESDMDLSANQFILADLISNINESFQYSLRFDFDWNIDILVENITNQKLKDGYVSFIDGEYLSPPEDCGGSEGLIQLKKILKGKKTDLSEGLFEWYGSNILSKEINYADTHRRINLLNSYLSKVKRKV